LGRSVCIWIRFLLNGTHSSYLPASTCLTLVESSSSSLEAWKGLNHVQIIWKLNADRITSQNWNRKNLNLKVIFVGVPNYKRLLKVICCWLKPLWEQIPFTIYRLGFYGLSYRYNVKEIKQNIVVHCFPYGELCSFVNIFDKKVRETYFSIFSVKCVFLAKGCHFCEIKNTVLHHPTILELPK